ncbi:MAG: hypothetical protein AAFO79_03930, partial [Pseudomonadota bacterium]
FLDHANYAGDDFTGIFIDALNNLACAPGIPAFQVRYQGNDGIVDHPLGQPWVDEPYDRQRKVPWTEMMKQYAHVDLFCVTHRESAGLGVIEAASSGATVVVPTAGTPFIARELLNDTLPHRTTALTAAAVRQIIGDLLVQGIDRQANHDCVSKAHDWSLAAQRIAATVTSMARN